MYVVKRPTSPACIRYALDYGRSFGLRKDKSDGLRFSELIRGSESSSLNQIKNFPFFFVLFPILVPLYLTRAVIDTLFSRKNEWALQDTKVIEGVTG